MDELKNCGIEAEFIHQNAFLNENFFKPSASIPRTHDAIYSASLAPYKRHALAARVESLIISSYTYGTTRKDDYVSSIRQTLAHAWWAKDSRAPAQKFTTEQIVDLYARAHVGLCLSAEEGGMFVSMEYLLCGLSVVSTRSIGGRDVFWDDRYVKVCDDTPESVAESVAELKARNIARDDIRRWTLEKIYPHRHRLRKLVRSLGAELECPWPPGSHGISSWVDLSDCGRKLRKRSAP